MGVELAGEVAELVHGVNGEAAEGGAFGVGGERRGREGGDGFSAIGGERIEADLQFGDTGGRARGRRRMAHLVAEGLDGGAEARRIFRSERNFLALDLEGVVIDMRGDFAEGFGRDSGDFGEAEVGVAELLVLLDEVIGVAAADAGVVGAELVPGETEVVEHVGVADLLEALGAGRGATAADGGEGILETRPGAEIALLFVIHEALLASIDAERGGSLLQTGQLAESLASIDASPLLSGDCLPPRPTLVWHGRGGGAGWKSGGK